MLAKACVACGEREITLPNPFENCLDCQWGQQDGRFIKVRTSHPNVQALMTELGMMTVPRELLFVMFSERVLMLEHGEKARGFRVEYVGGTVAPDADLSGWPSWRLSLPGRAEALPVQVWRQRVVCERSPVYGEILHHPERQSAFAIRGPEDYKTPWVDEIAQASRGLALLRDEERNKGGRPRTAAGRLRTYCEQYRRDNFGRKAPIKEICDGLDWSEERYHQVRRDIQATDSDWDR